MLASAARFADDAAGLEKILRLAQALCTIVVGLALSEEVAGPWRQARTQLAIGRRYFRFFKWHSCWNKAQQHLHSNEDGFPKLLAVCNWSFLGLYYLIELPTITNVMGVTDFAWGPKLQNEADKCWFYAICFSIVLTLYRLVRLSTAKPTPTRTTSNGANTNEKPKQPPVQPRAASDEYISLLKQLTIDCCDLTIPGFSTGWFHVNLATVGAAQFTSSALAIPAIWKRVQPGH